MDRRVDYVNGHAVLSDTGKIVLGGPDGSDTVEFQVGRGFQPGAEVNKLTLYQWVEEGNHQGPLVGTWDRENPVSEPFQPYLNVTISGTSIDVSDTNQTNAEYDYCFKVTVNDGTDHPTVDPELRVLKKSL